LLLAFCFAFAWFLLHVHGFGCGLPTEPLANAQMWLSLHIAYYGLHITDYELYYLSHFKFIFQWHWIQEIARLLV
jgi:hypothetical protein